MIEIKDAIGAGTTAMRGRTTWTGLAEMRATLRVHGYPIAAARALAAEGMGPEELAHRIRSTTPGGMGSLEFTHGITRRARGPSLKRWRVGALHGAFGREGVVTYYGTERGAKREANRIARRGGFGWVPFVQEFDLSGQGGGK